MTVFLHKILGYGLDSFEPPENWNTLTDKASLITPEKFIDFCLEHLEEISGCYQLSSFALDSHFRGMKSKLNGTIAQCIRYNPKDGLPGVLVLVPWSHLRQWWRVDDSLDYYQEKLHFVKTNRFARLDRLPEGIHPYRRHELPLELCGLLWWMGMPELAHRLEEVVYTYWAWENNGQT